MLAPIVRLGTTVLEGGKILAEPVEITEVEGGEGKPVAVRALGKNRTPRVHDEGPPVGPPAVGFLSPLGRRDHEGLVLHGPRPQQKFPVVLAGLERERSRDHKHLSTPQRQ